MTISREHSSESATLRPSRTPVLVTITIVAAVLASRLAVLGVATEREYDEGVYLLSARALAAGNALFSSVFSSQPPAFLETLAWTMRLAGDHLETARLLILAFTVIALL